jgi:hypothetical protein
MEVSGQIMTWPLNHQQNSPWVTTGQEAGWATDYIQNGKEVYNIFKSHKIK